MRKFLTTLLALFCAGSAFAFPEGGYNEGDAKVQGSLTVTDPDAGYDVVVEDGYIKLGDGWFQYNDGLSKLQFSNNAGVNWTSIGAGGTGGSPVYVNGAEVADPNFVNSTDTTLSVSGGNVSIGLSSAVSSNIGLGVTSYGWGNHGTAGYLTAEADTLQTVTTRGSSTTTNITTTGNVGIGSTAPTSKLDVAGDINISNGAYSAKIVESTAEGLAGADLRFGVDSANQYLLFVDKLALARDFGLSASSAPTLRVYEGGATPSQYIEFSSLKIEKGGGSTTPFQFRRNADVSTGNYFEFIPQSNSNELTSSSSQQAFLKVSANVKQTGTAAVDALYVDITDSESYGDGTTGVGNNLLRADVAGANKFRVSTAGNGYFAGNVSIGTTASTVALDVNGRIAGTGYAKGQTRQVCTSIPYPASSYARNSRLFMNGNTGVARTITSLYVTLDSDPTTEINANYKYADSCIGLANSTVINDLDTTAGERYDNTITSATIPAGKCEYIEWDAAPDSATTMMTFCREETNS